MTTIYVLKCPIAGDVRYIGKADDISERLRCHIKDAKKPRQRSYRAKWIRKLLSKNMAPELLILFHVPDCMSWMVAERFFIAAARTFCLRITNTAEGGEGGWLFSDASKARHAKAMKRIATDRMKDPHVRAYLSEMAKKQWQDLGALARRSEISRQKMCNPAARDESRRGAVEQNADPEYIRLRDERWSKPEAKQAAADHAKAGWNDPVKRLARIESLKAGQRARRKREASQQSPEAA